MWKEVIHIDDIIIGDQVTFTIKPNITILGKVIDKEPPFYFHKEGKDIYHGSVSKYHLMVGTIQPGCCIGIMMDETYHNIVGEFSFWIDIVNNEQLVKIDPSKKNYDILESSVKVRKIEIK